MAQAAQSLRQFHVRPISSERAGRIHRSRLARDAGHSAAHLPGTHEAAGSHA